MSTLCHLKDKVFYYGKNSYLCTQIMLKYIAD